MGRGKALKQPETVEPGRDQIVHDYTIYRSASGGIVDMTILPEESVALLPQPVIEVDSDNRLVAWHTLGEEIDLLRSTSCGWYPVEEIDDVILARARVSLARSPLFDELSLSVKTYRSGTTVETILPDSILSAQM